MSGAHSAASATSAWRRLLIDEEHLGRSKDGSRYWVALGSRNHPVFEPAVQDVNVLELLRSGREEAERRKQNVPAGRRGLIEPRTRLWINPRASNLILGG